MIIPPFDIRLVSDEELVAWYMREEGDSREEAEATVEILRNPELQEGLD